MFSSNHRRGDTDQVLLLQRKELVDSFGATVVKPHYRPDLYPEHLTFEAGGWQVDAEILEGRCFHAMLASDKPSDGPSLLAVLERFSGMVGWLSLDTSDSVLTEHFPAFNPSAPMNTFFTSPDRSAVALVQLKTPLGSVVVWLQSKDYPQLLSAYRGSKQQ